LDAVRGSPSGDLESEVWGSTPTDGLPMIALRGWVYLRGIANMLQIVGIIAIIGLVVVLVVMRRKDAAGTKTTKSSSTRI
jgi:hypothetical protein